MPVITRSQRKNITNAKPLAPVVLYRTNFINEMKYLLILCGSEMNRENKMRIALKIYRKINQEVLKFIAVEGLDRWIKFVATIFNKSTEFIQDRNLGKYVDIDKNLVENFFEEINQARNFTIDIIRNYNGLVSDQFISEAKAEILRLDNSRPRRNIKRVNYTGMDTIEPESEYDGITNIWTDLYIWTDLSIYKDPDYVFEEDEDDSEDEEDQKDEYNSEIHPELSTEEKTEIKQHMNKIAHNRVRRNLPPVNYAGMDMNEEDEGQIYTNKRWFEDGKVKYIWKRYSLSQANEIGDEDYVDEE